MNRLGMQGRRWEIFESAVQLFARDGYHKVSIREIADKNHITAPSLYNHFKSKDALLHTMYDFYEHNATAAISTMQRKLRRLEPGRCPAELFSTLLFAYDEELQPLMDQIYTILVTQSAGDPRAYELIKRLVLDATATAVGDLLDRLAEEGKIKAVDREAFVSLYVNYLFAAKLRNSSAEPIQTELRQRALELLYSLIAT